MEGLFAQVDIKPYFMFGYWIVFIMCSAIVAVILIGMWKKIMVCLESEDESLRPTTKDVIEKGAITVILILGIVAIAGYSYNLTLTMTASSQTPMNEALRENLEEIEAHEAATDEELQVNKERQVQQQYEKPHQEAIMSFDERMEKEARKIRDRNPELQNDAEPKEVSKVSKKKEKN